MRLRLDSGGVLFGRSLTCHVILDEANISKRQALVRLGSEGPELLPLGRSPSVVNGETIKRPTVLRPGDHLELPGGPYTVLLEGDSPPVMDGYTWVVETDDGWSFAPHTPSFSVGSHRQATLHIPEWPPEALQVRCLYQTAVASLKAPVLVNGEPQPEGTMVSLRQATRFECGGVAVSLLREMKGSAQTTYLMEEDPYASSLRLEFLPKGGRFKASFPEQPALAVELSELRCRLLAILMLPRDAYTPGDFLDDDDAIAGVWPRSDDKTNHDVNTLVYRVRQSLLSSGIDPFLILERSKTGAGTRLRVRPGTSIQVI